MSSPVSPRRWYAHAVIAICMALPVLSTPSQAQDSVVKKKALRLSGSFTPTQVRSSNVALRTQSRIYGNVELVDVGGQSPRSRVRLTFTSQSGGNSYSARWGILQGRCGTGSLPVMPLDNFPMIEVGSNGRAQLDTEIALGVPPSGEYHVNVYVGGQQLDNVITCANLKR